MIETSFGQDLNNDGVTGLNIPMTVIESTGATDLTQVGSNYYLYAHGTTTGPTVKFLGIDYVAGQFGAWSPARRGGGGRRLSGRLEGQRHRPLHGVANRQQRQLPLQRGARRDRKPTPPCR